MSHDKRSDDDRAIEAVEAIELETLATVSGALNLQYWYYRAGIAISQWDPSRVAINFLQ